jgi:hypothetical protein
MRSPCSVCLSVCQCVRVCIPLSVARQRLGKHVPAAMNKCNIRTVETVIFYEVRVISKESRRLGLPRTSCHIPLRFQLCLT